ncbi:hypothetical protein IMY05_C4762000800 [Salix suchowensis]|nr:hypothetical protein IMY05_C4762000800 [Salix suchowensis]
MSTTASMVAASSDLNFDNAKAQKKHEIEIHGKTYSLLLGQLKSLTYVETHYNLPYIDKKITYVLTRKRSDAPVQCPLCNHQVFSVVDLHYHMKKLHKALKTSIERTDNHDPPIHPPHLSFHSTQALSVASQDPPAVPLRMLSSAKAGHPNLRSFPVYSKSTKDNMNKAYIQTLYSTNDIYYSVRMPLPQSTNPMLHDYITSILPTIQQSDILLPGVSTLDYPVEVQMIGWHNHLATYLQSKVATRGLTSLLGPVSSTTRISQLKPLLSST